MDGYVNRQALQDIADAIREKNGSSDTYKPSEMAEAIRGIEGGGVNYFENLGFTSNEANALERINVEQYEYSLQKSNETYTALNNIFAYDKNLIFFRADTSNITNFYGAFMHSTLKSIIGLDFSKATNCEGLINSCRSVCVPRQLNMPKCTNIAYFNQTGSIITTSEDGLFEINIGGTNIRIENAFNGTYFYGKKLHINGKIGKGTSIIALKNNIDEFKLSATPWALSIGGIYPKKIIVDLQSVVEPSSPFIFGNGQNSLEELLAKNYKKLNINLSLAPKLTSSSVRYIIWHALNGENALGFENKGAISRTIQLHATPYASWEEWKTTKPSVEDCEFLGIDETEITQYGELTWEDIALNIKLITIGA